MQRSRKNDSPATSFRSRSHCSRSRRISPSVVFALFQVGAAQPNNKTIQRAITSLNSVIPAEPLITVAGASPQNSRRTIGSSFRPVIFIFIYPRVKIFPTIPSVHSALARVLRYDQSEFYLKRYEHSNFLVSVRTALPSAQEAP